MSVLTHTPASSSASSIPHTGLLGKVLLSVGAVVAIVMAVVGLIALHGGLLLGNPHPLQALKSLL